MANFCLIKSKECKEAQIYPIGLCCVEQARRFGRPFIIEEMAKKDRPVNEPICPEEREDLQCTCAMPDMKK